jgi:hypothetical protein
MAPRGRSVAVYLLIVTVAGPDIATAFILSNFLCLQYMHLRIGWSNSAGRWSLRKAPPPFAGWLTRHARPGGVQLAPPRPRHAPPPPQAYARAECQRYCILDNIMAYWPIAHTNSRIIHVLHSRLYSTSTAPPRWDFGECHTAS